MKGLLSIKLAVLYCQQAGYRITPVGLRKACQRKSIPAEKVGRDWLITKDALEKYIERALLRKRRKQWQEHYTEN